MSDDKNYFHIDDASGVAIVIGDVSEEMQRNFFEIVTTVERPVIYFGSPGGNVEIALAIYDLLQYKECTIVVNGLCASAGTLILQAAKRRVATPSSQFLVHFGSESAESEAERKHNKNVERYWLQLFQARTKASMRKVRKWHAGETFFNTQQALKEGLIDEVFTSNQTQSISPVPETE